MWPYYSLPLYRRRIAPKELVFTILDSLSYLKMNVLHFHLSDFCRYSVESEELVIHICYALGVSCVAAEGTVKILKLKFCLHTGFPSSLLT